jgi:hypothetical protein
MCVLERDKVRRNKRDCESERKKKRSCGMQLQHFPLDLINAPLSALLEYSSGALRVQANDGRLQREEAADGDEWSQILGPDG